MRQMTKSERVAAHTEMVALAKWETRAWIALAHAAKTATERAWAVNRVTFWFADLRWWQAETRRIAA